MNRFLSIVLKVTGVIYAGILTIAAIIALFGGLTGGSYMFGSMIVVALVYLGIGLAVFAMFWGLGNALVDIEELKATNRIIMEQNRTIMNKLSCTNESLKYNLSDVASNAAAPEPTWECPSCGKQNPKSIRNCKDCGYQK